MAESARRDADVTEAEQRGEALWIASMLSSDGEPADSARVEQILRLHRDYLAAPPPDEPDSGEIEGPSATDAAVGEEPVVKEPIVEQVVEEPAAVEEPTVVDEPQATPDADPWAPEERR